MPGILHDVQERFKGNLARGAFAAAGAALHTAHMEIARFRKARKLSQQDVADMLGVDAATVSRAENLHQSAKLTTYQAYADAMGVTLADLFADDLNTPVAELLQLFRQVPQSRHEELKLLLRMIREEPTEGTPQQPGAADR